MEWNATNSSSVSSEERLPLMNIVVIVCFILLMIFIICGNLMVIIAVIRFHHLRTIMNYCACQLAAADLCAATISIPLQIAYFVQPALTFGKWFCLLRMCLGTGPVFTSLLFLLMVSIDRWIAIMHPLHYPMIVTPQRLAFVSLLIWIYGYLFCLGPMIWNNWYPGCPCEGPFITPRVYLAIFAAQIVLFTVTSITLNSMILHTARHHEETLYKNRPDLENFKRDRKAANAFAVITVTMAICFLPSILVSFLQNILFKTVESTPPLYSLVQKVALAVALINSGVNPWIYCWKLTSFRTAFRQLLGLSHVQVDPISSNGETME